VKKLIAAAALIAFSAGMAFAADDMTFKAKNGTTIPFPHKAHQEALKDCKVCHEKGAGKIEDFGKDWAHKNCKGCHVEKGKGPTKCGECHKK